MSEVNIIEINSVNTLEYPPERYKYLYSTNPLYYIRNNSVDISLIKSQLPFLNFNSSNYPDVSFTLIFDLSNTDTDTEGFQYLNINFTFYTIIFISDGDLISDGIDDTYNVYCYKINDLDKYQVQSFTNSNGNNFLMFFCNLEAITVTQNQINSIWNSGGYYSNSDISSTYYLNNLLNNNHGIQYENSIDRIIFNLFILNNTIIKTENVYNSIKFYKNSNIELSGGFLGENIKYEIFKSFEFEGLNNEFIKDISFNGSYNISQNSITYSPSLESFCLTVQEMEHEKNVYTILLDNSFQTYKDTCANKINKETIQIPNDHFYQKLFIQDHSINVISIEQIIWSTEIQKFIVTIYIKNTISIHNFIAIITSSDSENWDLVKVFTEFKDINYVSITSTSMSITNNKNSGLTRLILTVNIFATNGIYVFININDLKDNNINKWWIPPYKVLDNIYNKSLITDLKLGSTISRILYIEQIDKYITFVRERKNLTHYGSYTDAFIGYSFTQDLSSGYDGWSAPKYFDFMTDIYDAIYDENSERVFAVGDFSIIPGWPNNTKKKNIKFENINRKIPEYVLNKIPSTSNVDFQKEQGTVYYNVSTTMIPSYTEDIFTGSRGVLVSGRVDLQNEDIIWDISRSKSIIRDNNNKDSRTTLGLIWSIKNIVNNVYLLAGRTTTNYNPNQNDQDNQKTSPMYALVSISGEDFSYKDFSINLVQHSKFDIDQNYNSIALTKDYNRLIILANNFIDTFSINTEYKKTNLKLVQDRIYLTRNINLNHKIIGLTQFNLTNNISKKGNKIYFHKPKQNIINKGFDLSNGEYYSTKIDLPENGYLFNTNNISNGKKAILNYKLYPLSRGNTSISPLNLGTNTFGLLKNISSSVNNISWINNNYIGVTYNKDYNKDYNIINQINYYGQSSISFELIESDISKIYLYLSYAFTENINSDDPLFYLIDTPRKTHLPQSIKYDILQGKMLNFPYNISIKPEYDIFFYNLKEIFSNLNIYLKNNEFILHYNNKINKFQNIDLHYDENVNGLLLRSLNRYFTGVVYSNLKLSTSLIYYDKKLIDYTIQIIINVICNPELCPLPALPDRRQQTYLLGSSATFRNQFSKNIQNSTHKKGSRKTILIDRTKSSNK